MPFLAIETESTNGIEQYTVKDPAGDVLFTFCAVASSGDDVVHVMLHGPEGGDWKALRRAIVWCSRCGNVANPKTAHRHQDEWIGDDCCWDERLKASE